MLSVRPFFIIFRCRNGKQTFISVLFCNRLQCPGTLPEFQILYTCSKERENKIVLLAQLPLGHQMTSAVDPQQRKHWISSKTQVTIYWIINLIIPFNFPEGVIMSR